MIVLCYGVIRVKRKKGCMFPTKINSAHQTHLSRFPLTLLFTDKEQTEGSVVTLG